MNTVVVGAQWGDEGKGKIVDLLAAQADIVVRYQGGNNAGHTVVIAGQTFKLHQIPSGIFHGKVCVLGNGVVVDPIVLLEEIKGLQAKGFQLAGRLFISDRAHVILPRHQEADRKQEESRASKVGTTGRGIGPAYTDKFIRQGTRFADCYAGTEFPPKYQDAFNALRAYVVDTMQFLHKAHQEGKSILLEGAQGTLLDIDHGTYPYVTSSNPTAGGACTGSGLGPRHIDRVIGVLKAYTTRVGNGPFPTELENDMGEYLRQRGGEFGTTTGRSRRCGWLDLAIARYAAQINSVDQWAITKLDVLDDLAEIPVCVGYKLNGLPYDGLPAQVSEWENLEPIYEIAAGWQTPTVGLSRWEQLPLHAKRYLERIERFTGVPVAWVSTGPGREETIEKS